MKTFRYYLIAFLLVPALNISCKNEDNNPALKTTNVVVQGSWQIVLFSEAGVNETGNFKDFTFSFTPGGVVTAVSDSISKTGTWETITESSAEQFRINLGTEEPLNELNQDWDILEKTDSKLRMEHKSGGSSSSRLLTLEKNR